MNFVELFFIALGLSMDAFAISVCKGLSTGTGAGKVKLRHSVICGLYFGGFQVLMPLIGYFLGRKFESLISNIAPIVAFVLLALIGVNMIRESRGEAEKVNSSFAFKAMLPLAIATSIDALVVGISFAMVDGTNIWYAITLIGITTLIISAIGVKIGSAVGDKFGSKAELAGGIILIVLGLKILVEYLFKL